jgi:hypothetical protein
MTPLAVFPKNPGMYLWEAMKSMNWFCETPFHVSHIGMLYYFLFRMNIISVNCEFCKIMHNVPRVKPFQTNLNLAVGRCIGNVVFFITCLGDWYSKKGGQNGSQVCSAIQSREGNNCTMTWTIVLWSFYFAQQGNNLRGNGWFTVYLFGGSHFYIS